MDRTFELYRSEDGTVSKYIHEDGSETAIKLVKSTQNIFNPITKEVELRSSDRNKYSVFISSSVGCFMKCQFCHLTLKGAKHIKLTQEEVLENLKEAIEDSVMFNPDMRNRFVKLSWMGMGDALNKPEMVYYVTLNLLRWVFDKGYAAGLDGVDLSTVMPPVKNSWMSIFQKLDYELTQKYKLNPIYSMDNVEYTNGYYSHKNVFRLFYSIGSPIQEIKDVVIPNAEDLINAMVDLREYSNDGQYTVILHHVLVDGMNDSDEELDALISYVNNNFPDNELRILRYNSCFKNDLKESEKLNAQIQKLSESINFLKVQISPGTEVSAACGQFIVKEFIRKGKL